MESFVMSFASMLLALGVVIAIAWFALRLLRDRMQPRVKGDGGVDDALRFVRALPVGAKERVVIVEHRGSRWMLGVTAGGISTIAQWPAAGELASSSAPVPGVEVGDASLRSKSSAGQVRQ